VTNAIFWPSHCCHTAQCFIQQRRNVDKLLASQVAELRARREQLQSTKNERQSVKLLQDEPGVDCSLQSEGGIATDMKLLPNSNTYSYRKSSELETMCIDSFEKNLKLGRSIRCLEN